MQITHWDSAAALFTKKENKEVLCPYGWWIAQKGIFGPEILYIFLRYSLNMLQLFPKLQNCGK